MAQYRPKMTTKGLSPTYKVEAVDQTGGWKQVWIAGESPLTIKVDDTEIVTLMTLGTHPEELSLGFLRNQRLMEHIEDIQSVEVDWKKETVHIHTTHGKGIVDLQAKVGKRTVTTGCGQGTVFSCTLDKLYEDRLQPMALRQSTLYALLRNIVQYNQIYKQAGGVHGCALCREDEVLMFVEDVGRHNAADTISGRMWLDNISGDDKIFYTTGRLTSEIVMKAATMRIPVLLSRSGITHMAREIAQDLNIMMIARAQKHRFLVHHGAEHIVFDQRLRLTPAGKPS